jgi:hypothetical protein
MKGKRGLIGVLVAIFVLSAINVVFAKGFDKFGYNYNARLFNGWYGYYDKNIEGGWVSGTGDAWLVMKWSKNWIPMEDEPVGAWCTNHWTWYSDDYDEDTWYGWDTKVNWNEETEPEAAYMVKEFLKIMKVGNDADEWARYQAGGAYDAGWGTYDNEVPKYVVFQDVIEVYDTETEELVATYDLCTAAPKGLGQPIF